MAEKDKVLGVDAAIVHLKEGGTAIVSRGEDLPPVSPEEKKRLKDLGVLDEPEAQPSYAQVVRSGQGAAPADDAKLQALQVQLDAALAAQADAEARANEAEAKAAADAAPK